MRTVRRMRLLVCCAVSLLLAPAAAAQLVLPPPTGTTQAIFIRYRAHDGVLRPALLLLPADYRGQRIPLVISPHGRGTDEAENGRFWASLPGRGGFAVINPGGEGRRLHWFSWGAPGEIADLARMPAIAEAHGVNVDPSRVYAMGGSMGGQEVLLLVATHPGLLAGAAAFDPDTDMARRYRDFASLKHGRVLQRLARIETGGTPEQVPQAYARRSPDHYARAIADSHVPLQLFWSIRDRVIRDQRLETGRLAGELARDRPRENVWVQRGEWAHTSEMQSTRRLPLALARFGLLPWRDVPRFGGPAVRPAPARPV
jgi:pimeloyl-ACP methyl ester carboxylesterase